MTVCAGLHAVRFPRLQGDKVRLLNALDRNPPRVGPYVPESSPLAVPDSKHVREETFERRSPLEDFDGGVSDVLQAVRQHQTTRCREVGSWRGCDMGNYIAAVVLSYEGRGAVK